MILNTEQNNCCNCRHYCYDKYNNDVYCRLLINMVYDKILPVKDMQELTNIEDTEELKEINMLTIGNMETLAYIPDLYHYVCGNWR